MEIKKIKQILNDNAELIFKSLGMNTEIFSENIYSTCPIHEGSDNPRAFSFSPKKGIWKCWTRDCQSMHSNDLLGLISAVLSTRENKNVEFVDALNWACDLLNIKRGKPKPKQELEIDIYEDFNNLVNIVSKNNTNKLTNDPINLQCDIKTPSKYFTGRGFNKKTLDYFGVGDCLDCKSALYQRAVIPIHSEDGSSIVGAIGRSIKEYKIPKFLLYPTGFDKRYCFYNYHRAINRVKETSCLFIVEGQGDVWRLYESGVTNVVSIFGKIISNEQTNKIMSLPITTLIILTDNDQAGRESKLQIKRQFHRTHKLIFPKMTAKDIGEMDIKQIQNEILYTLRGTY
jgi:5S rRNA maturation endonuclease (ribonuclease M5)